MYRAALVGLRPDQTDEILLEYSVALAQRGSLHLSGASILDPDLISPREPVPLGGMAFKAELDAARTARVRELLAATAQRFRDRCTAAGISWDVACLTEDLTAELSRAAQRYDLLLLGRTEEPAALGGLGFSSLLNSILKHCPGPALVVPGLPPGDAQNVVVAYDGSLQANRALKSFIASGLEGSSPVHVLTIADQRSTAHEAAEGARQLLLRYEYQVEILLEEPDSTTSIASQIQAACQRLNARMLVMGAYGQASIRDFFLGSVTKSLLAAMPIPMFLDH